eukprot:Gb_00888 [translate_table: standard]
MGFDHKQEQKRVTFKDQATENDNNFGKEYINDNKSGVQEKIPRNVKHNNGKGDLVIGIPVSNWGTHIMGNPAKPSTNPQNKLAATWTVPLLIPDLINAKALQGEPENGHSDHQSRKLSSPPIGTPGKPPVESGPYVLDGSTSPPPTPSGKCKVPFVPFFKNVAKFLTFPSFILARLVGYVAPIDAFMERLNRWSKNADNLTENFWSHMKLGGNMSETVWGKLSLGAKIVTEGGVENWFKLSFSVGPKEKLLKTSACYLSTTTGPVAGLLFISTEKLAFCSDRPLSFTSPNGGIAWSYYRVLIPLGRVSSVNPCENVNKPAEKYIQIQTVDNHEFWFMGFVNYGKALKLLQQAVH